MKETDVLVIGCGLAGLVYALKVAEFSKVTVLSKTSLAAGSTQMAQGGVAAVMAKTDSAENHLRDTLNAGAGLCDPELSRWVVDQGPDRISELINWGVKFDLTDNENFSLHKEGGHSHRRILHVGDHTGQNIHTRLLNLASDHPNITMLEQKSAIDLITQRQIKPRSFGANRCWGAYVLDNESGSVTPLRAKWTVLATGGAGKVYLYTSNWSGATGDGIAMAYRAGARVANLEFMQFHPTCLYHPEARNFLISEALRGEGAELVNAQGQAFMQKYDHRRSLAPRDIVARSIDAELKESGAECVYLDITHKSKDFLQKHFPKIYQKCLEFGIDISTTPIPVVPAAHYLCGGVMTDQNARTDIEGLLAIGETAHTGLHGANRLASNSLLECLAFGHSAARWTRNHRDDVSLIELPNTWPHRETIDSDELSVITHMWDEIRQLMWNYVGIVRTNRRLERAQHRIQNILFEIKEYYEKNRLTKDVIELRNIAIVADLTVKCALERQESRGIHYNLDFPETRADGLAQDSILDATSDPISMR